MRPAGADVVGGKELVAQVQAAGGSCLATTDMMPELASVARILGPSGLMPNPKLGTIDARPASGTLCRPCAPGAWSTCVGLLLWL